MDALNKLKEISRASKSEFLVDWKLQGSAAWYLYIAVQGCIDLAAKLIAAKALKTPESYADTFYILAEAGILNSNEAENFVKMAKFRNVLAHAYARIDLELVYEILQTKLDDIENCLKKLSKELVSLNNCMDLYL